MRAAALVSIVQSLAPAKAGVEEDDNGKLTMTAEEIPEVPP